MVKIKIDLGKKGDSPVRKKDARKVLLIAMAAVLWGNTLLIVEAKKTESQYEILEESEIGEMESVVIDDSESDITTNSEDLELEEGEPEELPENTLGDYTIPGLEEYQDAVGTDTQNKYGEAVLDTEESEENSDFRGDDFDYTGPLDGRTGKPITSNVTNDGSGVYIMGEDDYNFDSNTGRYEIMCGEMSVGCDVPPEALLSNGEKFNIYVPMGVTVTIYYNGE